MDKALRSPDVSLTTELADFISVRVATGRYLGAGEVVRAGLRLLERDPAAWVARLESGPSSDEGTPHGTGGSRG